MRVANAVDHKVILVGDPSVGKTSIIQQYSMQVFSASTEPTIGASFISKAVDTEKGIVQMHIWDTAGQERYKSLIPMYVRNAVAAVLVFDVTVPKTYENLHVWLKLVEQIKHKYIVANKMDLGPQVPLDKIEQEFKDMNCTFFRATASEFDSVRKIFDQIAIDIQETPAEEEDDGHINVGSVVKSAEQRQKGGCC